MDKRDEVKQVRFEFAPGQGDLLSDLRAFETWRCNQRQMSERDLRAWCQERFLSIQTLREVESNRAQLASSLKEQGFLPLDYAPRTSPATTAAPSSPLNAHGDNNALLRALLCAAMHPQIQRVAFPATRFAASHTGSVALDPEARAIKYFDAAGARGFVHPGSACFDAPRGWASDVRFLAVWERVRVGGQGGGAAGAAAQQQQLQDRGRTYLRGVTPCNTFSVLMFAGPLAVDTMGRGMLVDGWIRVRGWARIGVLVARLRGLLDRVLERKVDEPMRVLSPSELRVLDLVRRLVERDGMDR
jgi:hypothetical protein